MSGTYAEATEVNVRPLSPSMSALEKDFFRADEKADRGCSVPSDAS